MTNEVMTCVDAGCPTENGCPSMPPPHPLNPFNVGDQNGDGVDDYEELYICPCVDASEDDPDISGGYCEGKGVKKRWLSNSDPNKISVQCLTVFCTNGCTVEDWEEPNPPWPNSKKRKETCKCK